MTHTLRMQSPFDAMLCYAMEKNNELYSKVLTISFIDNHLFYNTFYDYSYNYSMPIYAFIQALINIVIPIIPASKFTSGTEKLYNSACMFPAEICRVSYRAVAVCFSLTDNEKTNKQQQTCKIIHNGLNVNAAWRLRSGMCTQRANPALYIYIYRHRRGIFA